MGCFWSSSLVRTKVAVAHQASGPPSPLPVLKFPNLWGANGGEPSLPGPVETQADCTLTHCGPLFVEALSPLGRTAHFRTNERHRYNLPAGPCLSMKQYLSARACDVGETRAGSPWREFRAWF